MVAGRRGFIRTASGLLVFGTGNILLPRTSAAHGKYGIELDGAVATTSKYGLEIEGVKAGWVWSVEGGHAAKAGGETLSITSDDSTHGTRLVEWMQPGVRRSGALIDAATGERLEFTNALITEIGFPALDGSSKDAAYLTLKIAPEKLRRVAGKPLKVAPLAAAQTKWLPSNFRIRIDGFDQACARVSKIDALTVKQKVAENPVDLAKEPGKIDIPNLVITLPESHADEFAAWTKAYAAKQSGPRAGTLTYLAGDGVTAKYIVVMKSIRPLKISPDKVESGSEQLRGTTREEVERVAADQIRRVKVEMYCEDFRLAPPA